MLIRSNHSSVTARWRERVYSGSVMCQKGLGEELWAGEGKIGFRAVGHGFGLGRAFKPDIAIMGLDDGLGDG